MVRYLQAPEGQDGSSSAWPAPPCACLFSYWSAIPSASLRKLAGPAYASWFDALGAEAMNQHAEHRSRTLADVAVAAFTAAVETGRDLDPRWPGYSSNLGSALRAAYDDSGDVNLLRAAQEAHQVAVDSTSPRHPQRAGRLANLSATSLLLFERGGSSQLLTTAVCAAEQAEQQVSLEQEDTLAEPQQLVAVRQNLAMALLSRFEASGDAADLRRATQLTRQALQELPEDRRRIGLHANLGALLFRQFERFGGPDDLREAEAVCGWVLSQLDADDPDRGAYANALVNVLHARYGLTGDPVLLTRPSRSSTTSWPASHPTPSSAPRYWAVWPTAA